VLFRSFEIFTTNQQNHVKKAFESTVEISNCGINVLQGFPPVMIEDAMHDLLPPATLNGDPASIVCFVMVVIYVKHIHQDHNSTYSSRGGFPLLARRVFIEAPS